MAERDDDLAVSKTEGFKVGEKKTIDEYQKLGKNVATAAIAIEYSIQPTADDILTTIIGFIQIKRHC